MFLHHCERWLFFALVLFLPLQLGKHFWPDFAFVSGIRIDYLSPTLYITDILVLILFSLFFINKVRQSQVIIPHKAYSPLLVVVGFFVLNLAIAYSFFTGLYTLLKIIEFSFLAYYVSSEIKTIKDVIFIVSLLAFGVIGEALLAIIQFVQQGSLGGLLYWFGERTFTAMTPGIANASLNGVLVLRPYGTFPHPNVLSGYTLVVLSYVLFLCPLIKRRLVKVLFYCSLFLGTVAVVLSLSRISLSLWILLLFIVFITYAKRWVSVVLVSVVLFALLFSPIASRLLQTSLHEEAFVQRETLIRASLYMVSQQPIVGIGLGSFLPMLATVAHPFSATFFLQPVHNIFLLIFAETGIVGLGFVLWFLVRTIRRLFSLFRRPEGYVYRVVFVSLTIVLVTGLFDHYWLTLQQGQLLLSFVVGFCWMTLQSKVIDKK